MLFDAYIHMPIAAYLGAISDLIPVRVIGFAFGRTFSVGIEPSKMLFLICLLLLAIMGLLE
jgi:hypothetical protein